MLIFSTPTDFDLRSITIMGMNAKPASTSPIGYFGTGLKYALAVLAREGCEVELHLPHETLRLRKEPANFRGQDFEALYLGSHQLPFTTELGKNWTVLMAYRELVTNTRDENGIVVHAETFNQVFTRGACIQVSGPAIEDAYRRHSEMFLDNKRVIETLDGAEVCFGSSDTIYYKGVNVGKLPSPLPFTINFVGKIHLTEDRTWSSIWNADWYMRGIFAKATAKPILDAIVTPALYENTYFRTLSWDQVPFNSLSDPLVDFLHRRLTNGHWIPLNLISHVQRCKGIRPQRKQLLLSDEDQEKFSAAKRILAFHGVDLSRFTIELVERMDGTVAQAEHESKTIVLTASAFDESLTYLVGVLYEEYCHLAYGYPDESRAMQNHLFSRLGEMMTKLARGSSGLRPGPTFPFANVGPGFCPPPSLTHEADPE